MALAQGITDLVIVGDSRIAVEQAQGVIQCLTPRLQLLLNEFDSLRQKFHSVKLVHVKREFNAAADYLTSKTLLMRQSLRIDDPVELAQLKQLSRIPEKILKQDEAIPAESGIERESASEANNPVVPEPVSLTDLSDPLTPEAKVFVMTRNQTRVRDAQEEKVESARSDAATHPGSQRIERDFAPENATPTAAIAERWRRILAQQKAEPWTRRLRDYLHGDLQSLSAKEAEEVAKVAGDFVLDSRGVLYYLSRPTPSRPRDAAGNLRLVVPSSLREDLLHLTHEEFQGAHQGITRTFERLRQEYYWPGMYADVQRFVKECVDCVTAKGAPPNPGPSPGNLLATRPFEVVSMDFVTNLPKSDRGNVFLLLFQCAFSGFIMCKPMGSTTAQEVAEAYMECVFQRFGASEMLRHDRDPRFMSDVFTRFREMLGSRQRATLAYRPQANGQQERSVQTVIRAIRAYVSEPDQSDWDDQVEKLMWALNTSFDATRLDTPFYLVHGWDPQSTVSAMLGKSPSGLDQRTAYEWRRTVQRQYEFAQAWAKDLQAEAKAKRSEAQTKIWKELSDRLKSGFEVGDAVWLFLGRVQPGLTKKFAHLWHGPFRIMETSDDFRCKLKIEGSGYRVYPWVHVSRLKPRALFPDRPTMEVEVSDDDGFDAALLPEDVSEPDGNQNIYEVEAIQDVRWVKRTRTSRRVREYLVKWKGYSDSEWLPVSQLSCGALLYDFHKSARAQARFQAMQSGNELPESETQ